MGSGHELGDAGEYDVPIIDVEEPTDGSGGDVATVALELRALIGRVRSKTMFDQLVTPYLDAIAGMHDRVPERARAAISALDDDRYRTFLEILLPLPFNPPDPWEPLTGGRGSDGRGERAAREAFGLTWDACLKRGQLLHGRSRRDWAEHLLAERLLGVATVPTPVPDAEGVVGAVDTDHLDETLTAARRGGHRRVVLVAAAVAFGAIVASVVGWALSSGSDREAEAVSTTAVDEGCVPAGTLSDELEALPGEAELSVAVRDAVVGYGRPSACGEAPMARWDGLGVASFDTPDSEQRIEVVARLDNHQVFIMSTGLLSTYRRVGSGDGSLAQRIAGLPVGVDHRPDGSVELRLSEGVVVVAADVLAPGFWIAAAFVDWWRAHPEVGLPTGNPQADLTQDFTIGELSVTGGPEPTAQAAVNPAAELGPVERLEERILRQADGTAWWVEDRARYWIPDGGVWDCLGGDAVVWPGDVHGYAVATLDFAGHAKCPK